MAAMQLWAASISIPSSANINLELAVGVKNCPELVADVGTAIQKLEKTLDYKEQTEGTGSPMQHIGLLAKIMAALYLPFL